LRGSTRLLDHSPVKGKKKAITVFEVIWQHEDATNLATSLLLTPRPVARLLLRHQEEEVQLDHDRPSVSVVRAGCYRTGVRDLIQLYHLALDRMRSI